jgi:ribonuclease VapC
MVVDTSALIAILLGEPEAQRLAETLASADRPGLSATNWLEAMIVIRARLGAAGTRALLDLIATANIVVEPADRALAQRAFDAWIRFGKGRHRAGLNYGDCFAYALAMQQNQPLLFKGDDFGRTDVRAA